MSIIYGPSGSGKTSLCRVFVQGLIDELNLDANQTMRWCLSVDAASIVKDFNILWNKITRFSDNPFEKLPVKYRLLIIDNISAMPPSVQQVFKKVIMENQAGRLKYIFICNDPKTQLIGYIQNKGFNISVF